MTDLLAVPTERQQALIDALRVLSGAQSMLLTTHVNADGDGIGCETALAQWLVSRGTRVWIANPTPYPQRFGHLLRDPAWLADPGTGAAVQAATEAELVVVLDTAEPKRIGRIASTAKKTPVLIIDHHLPTPESLPGTKVIDTSACATGELIYDLLAAAALPKPWPAAVLEGIYTAIVTDTGSFRFSNTTPRAHAIIADLIEQGVDPEHEFKRLFATVPMRRIKLLRHALDTIESDPRLPLTWMTISNDIMAELEATSDDLDGVIDHARALDGTEIAVLFRETSDGQTKVSLRSSGEIDVNAIARRFGGGGHIKASGALIAQPLDTARERVLEASRDALLRAGLNQRVSLERLE